MFLPCLATASAVLDFEGPLPGGLTPTSFFQGAVVPSSARVTDQFLSQGVVISNAAVVAGGIGHSASGVNSLAGVDSSGQINYDQAVSFSFYEAGDLARPATTDFFAYSADLGGGSGNTITISAFDEVDTLIGQVSYLESGTFASPLVLSGFGQFHRITVDQTLIDTQSGGIMIDLVQFGDIVPLGAVPEPGSLGLTLLAVIALVRAKKCLK